MSYLKDFLAELKIAVAVLRREESVILDVYERKSAMKWGIFIMVFPQIVELILSSFTFPSGFSAIFSRFLFWPIMIPLVVLCGIFFAMSFTAKKLFDAHTNHVGFFRVLAYASLIFWIMIVPSIFDIVGFNLGNGFDNLLWLIAFVWIMVVVYYLLTKEYKLNFQSVMICLGVGVITYFLIHLILGQILVGSYYKIFG